MAKKTDRNLIVGLDIGTSKIAAIVGEVTADGEIDVIGIGEAPSNGLKKGVVVNLEVTAQAIQKAIEGAEMMADCQIHSVFAGISGSHVKSLNSHGIVAIKDKEVTQFDVNRVIDSARAVAIPADQKILHILPQEYIIDSQDGIKESLGMFGTRLEARVHIVTSNVNAAQNIIQCIRNCALEVDDIVLEPLASGNAVLSNDEKDLGVCLLDIGAGTTDIAVYLNGAIKHTAVIPIAGDQVTNDIAVSLRTPTLNAEDIKCRYACALVQMADPEMMIDVQGISDRAIRVSAKQLAEIVEARYEELLILVQSELRRSGFERQCVAGLVLTGGSSSVPGLLGLAENIFGMPVRLGNPQGVVSLSEHIENEVIKNPIHATGIGLLMYGKDRQHVDRSSDTENVSLLTRLKNWFQNNL